MKFIKFILLIVILVVAGAGYYYIKNIEKPIQKETKAIVNIALSIKKNVPKIIEVSGIVEAFESVDIKSRIDGEILKVNFKEGQEVRKGDILFEIDDRNFKIQLDQSNANLVKDTASLENADSIEKRYSKLLQSGYISVEEYTTAKTNRDVLRATVESDKAAIENSKLQIEYCKISSPVNGKTGNIFLKAGNLVKANDTNPMVTINTISPIYVTFQISDQYLDVINKISLSEIGVIIKTSNIDEAQEGELVFIDNQIDKNTGTVKLKALLPNSDKTLLPGQFLNVVLKIKKASESIIVPVTAIQTNSDGQYVFVISEDNKAYIRKVNVDYSDDHKAIISNGLKDGEKVVIEGQIRLSTGTNVEIGSIKDIKNDF